MALTDCIACSGFQPTVIISWAGSASVYAGAACSNPSVGWPCLWSQTAHSARAHFIAPAHGCVSEKAAFLKPLEIPGRQVPSAGSAL